MQSTNNNYNNNHNNSNNNYNNNYNDNYNDNPNYNPGHESFADKIRRGFMVILAVSVLLALLLIHIAYYLFVRNIGNTGLGAGYTGWTATLPLFFNNYSEFVAIGFIIVPLVLLSLAYLGRWFDLPSLVVALVFAVTNVVVVLFGTAGAITVHQLDYRNPYNMTTTLDSICNNINVCDYSLLYNNPTTLGGSTILSNNTVCRNTYYCNFITTTRSDGPNGNNNGGTSYGYLLYNNNTLYYNSTLFFNNPNNGVNNTLVSLTQTETITSNTTNSTTAAGPNYCENQTGVYANAYCHGQSILIAGLIILLLLELLQLLLAISALRHAKRNWLAVRQVAVPMQPVATQITTTTTTTTTPGVIQEIAPNSQVVQDGHNTLRSNLSPRVLGAIHPNMRNSGGSTYTGV